MTNVQLKRAENIDRQGTTADWFDLELFDFTNIIQIGFESDLLCNDHDRMGKLGNWKTNRTADKYSQKQNTWATQREHSLLRWNKFTVHSHAKRMQVADDHL